MIGKIGVGKSAYGLLRYCMGDKKELSEEDKIMLSEREGVQHQHRAEVLHYNLCGGDVKELNSAFREVELLSKRVEKPVFHISLRPAGADQLTNAQWVDIAEACAKEFSFDEHQYLVILHKDAKEPHIHIVANRVGFDGKAISTSNNYARMATFCRRIEKQYGLTEVPGTKKPLSMHNTHEPMQNSREEKLRADLKKVLIHSRNYPDFERQITALGYQVIKGRGISFVDEKKVKIKGSEVGFSLATIEKILRQNSLNPSQKEQILQQQKQLDRKEKQDFEKDSRPFQGAEKQPEESLAGSLLDTLFESEETHSPVIDPWRLREEKRKRKSKGQRIN